MQYLISALSRSLLLASVCLVFNSAHADVLILKNGDRITGSIKAIWDGEVSIEPEYADEFDVDLEVVEYIESDREFEVELWDGREATVKLPGAGEDKQQLVTFGDESLSVDLVDILELDEPAAARDWESHVDFSATVNSGNTESTTTQFRGDILFETPDHRHFAEYTQAYEETDDLVSKDQDLIKYSYNWLFSDPWFFAANASHERDPIVELDSRLIVSAGIGRDIFNTPRKLLSIQLGAGAQSEDRSLESDESSVGVWTLRYRHDFINGDLELFHNHSITENLSGRDNTSVKTSTGVRYEITDLLYVNFTVNWDYESEPPDLTESEDMTMLLGIGLEFD
jgi:putative salt-induced outer membrane protein YdiY